MTVLLHWQRIDKVFFPPFELMVNQRNSLDGFTVAKLQRRIIVRQSTAGIKIYFRYVSDSVFGRI